MQSMGTIRGIRKASLCPVILEEISLLGFIQYVLDSHTPPTTLIVCSTRAAFLQQLVTAVEDSEPADTDIRDIAPSDGGAEETGEEGPSAEEPIPLATPPHPLLIPTLHLLATSRTVRLIFCHNVPVLQAYLSTFPFSSSSNPPPASNKEGMPMLALLNPLALHSTTSSFSAQGLARTIASAVSSASSANLKLVIAECPAPSADAELQVEGMDIEAEPERDGPRGDGSEDPWSRQIGILNVTTRTFGAGERGWVGRTVEARRVVGRWCRFERVRKDEDDDQDGGVEDEMDEQL